MNNNNLNLLSDRIEKLETRLGWWQLISFAALTCLAIYISLNNVQVRGSTCIKKITNDSPVATNDSPVATNDSTLDDGRFSKISIVDSEGRARAILSVGPKGPQLSLMNEDVTTGCTLTLDKTYGASLVFRKNDQTRVSLTSIPSALICADPEGLPRAILAVSKKGDGVFSLTSSDGQPIGNPGNVAQATEQQSSQLPSSE